MIGETDKQSTIFQMVTMEDLVPEDYFYRKVNNLIDFRFIREIVADKYCANNGRPSVDPELIMRMLLIGYLENLSDLRLSREIQMHAGYRWFCKLDFNVQPPDRTTLIKVRQRWGLEVFDQIFRRIVDQCISCGLVKGNLVAIDGTQVQARAAINSLEAIEPVISIDEYLNRFKDESPSEKPPKPPRKGGDPNFKGEQFTNQTHRSKTDPEAKLFRKSDRQEVKLSYLVHNALNVKSGVIIETEGTQANGFAEPETALEFFKHFEKNTVILMDKKYRIKELLVQAFGLGLKPLVPMKDLKFETLPTWKYHTCKLNYQRRRHKLMEESKARNYARLLNRKFIFKKTYRQRIKIEHKFAEAKEWHGLDRARGYGLESLRIQAKMTATVQNIKRLVSYLRRSKPRANKCLTFNGYKSIIDCLFFKVHLFLHFSI